MQATAVTKAAFLSLGVVVASIALTPSVAKKQLPASVSPSFSATITFLEPTRKSIEHAAATPITQQKPDTPTLLPIVDQPDILEHQRILADTVLKRLPSLCRDSVKHFFVLYSDAKNRGLGGKTSIVIDGTVPDNEFVGLLVHECGHVIHGNLLGNLSSGASAFRDGKDIFATDSSAAAFFSISWSSAKKASPRSQKQDFVSGYAQTDPFEDFAETFTMYILQRPALEAHALENPLIAAKLRWMETNLPLSDVALVTPLSSWNGNIPWDATKLSFVWRPVAMSAMQ